MENLETQNKIPQQIWYDPDLDFFILWNEEEEHFELFDEMLDNPELKKSTEKFKEKLLPVGYFIEFGLRPHTEVLTNMGVVYIGYL